MTTLRIDASDLIDAYEDSIRQTPKAAALMVIWLMIYDEQPDTRVHEVLEEKGVLQKATDKKTRASQIQKVRRWRVAAETSTGLPARGKKGTSDAYRIALVKWKAINPRPTKEQLLSGWVPKPLRNDEPHLHATPPGHDSAEPVPFTSPVTTEENTPLDTTTETPRATGMVGRTSASELTPEYLEKARRARSLLGSDEI